MNNLYSYITTNTTTTLTTKPCILSGLTINKTAANGVITIYDGNDASTGTIIAIITQPGTLIESQVSINFHDITLVNGLVIVTSAAAQDITVAYRAS